MQYEVVRDYGYSINGGDAVWLRAGDKLPKDFVEKGFGTQESLDYAVKQGRLRIVQSDQVSDSAASSAEAEEQAQKEAAAKAAAEAEENARLAAEAEEQAQKEAAKLQKQGSKTGSNSNK